MNSQRTASERTIVEVDLSADPDRVWRWLREPADIRRWFGWEHASLDHEIRAVFFDGVEQSEAARCLRIVGVDTTFSVQPSARGATLRVSKQTSEPPPVHDEIEEGWVAFVHQLRLALERHPDQDRRTLHHLVSSSEPASATEGAIPGPEALAGETWFRTAHQQGWLIPAWGDGLLIVHRFPPEPTSPFGKRSVLLTTYGMTPAAFNALSNRWAAWNAAGGETS
jgi:uncharacterized protein YndB with AHSA1/START domain